MNLNYNPWKIKFSSSSSLSPDFRIIYGNDKKMGERLFLSGFPAMLALEEIRLQILQQRMPLMATSRLSSSHAGFF